MRLGLGNQERTARTSMNDNTSIITHPLTQIALWLGSLGFHLIPIHSLDGSGGCTCGHPSCRSKAKHPRTPNGSKDATNHPALLIHLFGEHFPDANVGIATGANTGVFVLDVDPRHGGDQTLAALEKQHGKLPVTVTSATGGGGLHFFFQHPGGTVKNSAGALGDGLDIRGEGGLVVAPPSVHASGTRYAWMPGRAPGEVPIASPPAWLLQRMRGGTASSEARAARREEVREIARRGVVEGARNEAVAQLAGHLLRHRVDPYVALDLVRAWNSARNAPPLDDDEVEAAVDSIAGRELARRGGRHDR